MMTTILENNHTLALHPHFQVTAELLQATQAAAHHRQQQQHLLTQRVALLASRRAARQELLLAMYDENQWLGRRLLLVGPALRKPTVR